MCCSGILPIAGVINNSKRYFLSEIALNHQGKKLFSQTQLTVPHTFSALEKKIIWSLFLTNPVWVWKSPSILVFSQYCWLGETVRGNAMWEQEGAFHRENGLSEWVPGPGATCCHFQGDLELQEGNGEGGSSCSTLKASKATADRCAKFKAMYYSISALI